MKVVVLGGYGNFGARISRALAGDPAIQLIVAGRDLARAQAFAAPLAAAAAALDSTDAGLAGHLRALGAQRLGESLRAGEIASGHDEVHRAIAGKRAGDACTEVAVATQHHDLHAPSSGGGCRSASTTSSPYSVSKDSACSPCSRR